MTMCGQSIRNGVKLLPSYFLWEEFAGVTSATLCYAIMLPGRAGNRPSGPDFGRTATGKAPNSALRRTEGPISVLSRQQSGQNPARKADLRPGSTIA